MTIIDIPSPAPVAVHRKPRVHRPPMPPQCRELLADAGRALDRAMGEQRADDRFAAAHVAALRCAAAVLAARARPRRTARRSAWDLLRVVAPEFDEWAAFFAASAVKRQAIDAGALHVVTRRDADDLVRQCGEFIDLVDGTLRQ